MHGSIHDTIHVSPRVLMDARAFLRFNAKGPGLYRDLPENELRLAIVLNRRTGAVLLDGINGVLRACLARITLRREYNFAIVFETHAATVG
jgi:hypothetical protein